MTTDLVEGLMRVSSSSAKKNSASVIDDKTEKQLKELNKSLVQTAAVFPEPTLVTTAAISNIITDDETQRFIDTIVSVGEKSAELADLSTDKFPKLLEDLNKNGLVRVTNNDQLSTWESIKEYFENHNVAQEWNDDVWNPWLDDLKSGFGDLLDELNPLKGLSTAAHEVRLIAWRNQIRKRMNKINRDNLANKTFLIVQGGDEVGETPDKQGDTAQESEKLVNKFLWKTEAEKRIARFIPTLLPDIVYDVTARYFKIRAEEAEKSKVSKDGIDYLNAVKKTIENSKNIQSGAENFEAIKESVESARKPLDKYYEDFTKNSEESQIKHSEETIKNPQEWKRDTTFKKIYMSGADWISNRFSAVLFWYGEDGTAVEYCDTVASNDQLFPDCVIISKEGFAVRFGSISIPQPHNDSFTLAFGETNIKKLKPIKLLERKAQFSLRLDSNLYWMEKFGALSGVMLPDSVAKHHMKSIAKSYPIGNGNEKKLCLIIACQDLSNYAYYTGTRTSPKGWSYFFEDIKITGIGDSFEYNADGGTAACNIDFIFKNCYKIKDISKEGVTLVS